MPADEIAYLSSRGRLSTIRQMRGMLRRLDDSARTLVELKAVDAAYPLVGQVGTSPQAPLDHLLSVDRGLPGIVVDPLILDRLHLKIGDEALLAQRPGADRWGAHQ